MKRTLFESLITEKSLHAISRYQGDYTMDFMRQDDSPLKNVCARLSSELAMEVEQISALLDISKRVFIQAAIYDAVLKARQIIKDEGVEEFLSDIADASRDPALYFEYSLHPQSFEPSSDNCEQEGGEA